MTDEVAAMMVDQIIGPGGCEMHSPNENAVGIESFTSERSGLLSHAHALENPEFAYDNRLPRQARLNHEDSDEDEWENGEIATASLTRVSPGDWKRGYQHLELMFTGGPATDDEGDESRPRSKRRRLNRYLDLSIRNLLDSPHHDERRRAEGDISFDIDSVLAIFSDLSAINTDVYISIDSNAAKNLKGKRPPGAGWSASTSHSAFLPRYDQK